MSPLRLSSPLLTTVSLIDCNSRFPFFSIDKYAHKMARSPLVKCDLISRSFSTISPLP
jgi:hypothetical protein